MAVNRTLKILIFAALIAAICISFVLGGRYEHKHLQVLYISQAEILALEKARIKDENLESKQLFFGRPEAAVKYIEQVQNRMTKSGDLVLLTDSKIYGRNVSSVSREVHNKVVSSLKTSKNNE